MSKNKVDLRLLITNFDDITHDDITQMIGVEPAYIHVKGDLRNPRNPNSPLRKKNLWAMTADLEEHASFDDQMNGLLDIIEKKLDVFKTLCEKYYCEFACAIFVYTNNEESTPWVHLGERYNNIIKQINIEFDIDLYVRQE